MTKPTGRPRKQYPLSPRLPAHLLKVGYRTERGKRAHRVLVESRTGIKLPAKAVVHHVDPNDKATNLGLFVVCEDGRYHNVIERRQRALRDCGHASWRKCRECGKWDDPANLRIWSDTTRPWQEKVSHFRWKGACVNKGDRADVRIPHRKPALWKKPERFDEAQPADFVRRRRRVSKSEER